MTRLAAALAALLILAGCGPSDPKAGGAITLHVGSQKGSTKAMMVASGALDGATYRVEWSEFPAAQPLLEAIGSGAVDLGLAGDAPFMFAYQGGSPIKAIAAQTVGTYPAAALSILVPAGSPVRTLADLKGRKVATTRGSIGHYLVIRALIAAHLPPDYVALVFLSPGDAKAAFSSGAIDAWSAWTPYTSTALKQGARVLVDAPGLLEVHSFDVANERTLAAHRLILADFLAREARALHWAHDHPKDFAAVLARETGLPEDVALDYATKNSRLSVPLDAKVIDAQRTVLKDFQTAGAFKTARPVDAAFDPVSD